MTLNSQGLLRDVKALVGKRKPAPVKGLGARTKLKSRYVRFPGRDQRLGRCGSGRFCPAARAWFRFLQVARLQTPNPRTFRPTKCLFPPCQR